MTTDLNLRDAVIDNTHRAGDDELRIYLADGRRVTIRAEIDHAGGPLEKAVLVVEVETKVT
jgi:hypothetical protein